MYVQDEYRAQYFLHTLETEISKIEKNFQNFDCFSRSFSYLLKDFLPSLLIELDQILLPTIVYEIHRAKELGLLKGNTSNQKYLNFFVDDYSFTQAAHDIIKNYPFLLKLLDGLIEITFKSLSACLNCYHKDQKNIQNWLGFSNNTKIHQIEPLNGADRHCRQQAFVLTFTNNEKIIYKPVDLTLDILFKEFLGMLELDPLYELKTLNILSRDGYGWIEFLNTKHCDYDGEIQNFYRRMGVTLAVADALNYTDGHCENLIAIDQNPVLLDGETFFQNYAKPVAHQKNILSTMLIQKIDADSTFSISALQAWPGNKFECLETHAINDGTDEIQVRFSGLTPSLHHHCPILVDKPCLASHYIDYILEGFRYTYDRITEKVNLILSNTDWWNKVENVHSRMVLRDTAAYVYLLRKMQQPDSLISESQARQNLLEKITGTPYEEYEVSELLSLNIPYFYHIPGKKHLYDGNGKEYLNVFSETAVDTMRNQFLNRSEAKKNFDCEIILRHLSITAMIQDS